MHLIARRSTTRPIAISLALAVAACSSPRQPTPRRGDPVRLGSGSDADIAVLPLDLSPPTSGAHAKPPVGVVAPLPPVPTVKVTLTDVGLEVSSLDRTVDPCIDFYQFACGGWIKANPLPTDRVEWSRRSELEAKAADAVRGVLEEAAKGIAGDPVTKQVGDFYASCMDTAAIEQAGLAAAKPQLERFAKVKDPASWIAGLGDLHGAGNWIVWRLEVASDLQDGSSQVLYLDSGRLGLTSRDYYSAREFKDKLDSYRAHVARMLGLAGITAPTAADDVVAIESELAKLRDAKASYNASDGQKLARGARTLDWKSYWKALGNPSTKKLIVAAPRLVASLDALRARFRYPQWANYFAYHALAHQAHALPAAFGDELFAVEHAITGATKPPSRAMRCVAITSASLGHLVTQLAVTKQLAANSKSQALSLVEAIGRSFDDRIGALDWMTEPAKLAARAKLARLGRLAVGGDKPRSYPFAVHRGDLVGNWQRARGFEVRRQLAKAGQLVDRSEWESDPLSVSPSYQPRSNLAVLPAASLAAPLFQPDRAVAANFGGLGVLFAREMVRGFDDQGAQFDAAGTAKPWWSEADSKQLATKAACVSDGMSRYEAAPKQFVNGKLVLAETIADGGGLKVAFDGYRAQRRSADKLYVADGFDEDQQFFIAAAQAQCATVAPSELQRQLASGPMAPAKLRVYWSMRNLREFASAFRCAPGTPMHPAKICTVW